MITFIIWTGIVAVAVAITVVMFIFIGAGDDDSVGRPSG